MKTPARRIVITGAGNGLGRALAIGFSNDGYAVFGAARGKDGLAQTEALCPPGQFVAQSLDVSQDDAVAGWIAGIEGEHGPIDALVCAAAIYPRAHFLDQPAAQWDEVMRINIGGVANACRAVLPGMLARYHGRIIVIGSLADMRPIPAASAYSVSKGALHALTKAIASEIDRSYFPDVLIGEYLPPATLTGMNDFGVAPEYHYPFVKALVDGDGLTRSGGSFLPQGEMFLDPSPKSVLRNLKRRFLARRR
jgi:NAD(P)-dependent dehydrogenase (short-subunit alcohol dehydrogenase family)